MQERKLIYPMVLRSHFLTACQKHDIESVETNDSDFDTLKEYVHENVRDTIILFIFIYVFNSLGVNDGR